MHSDYENAERCYESGTKAEAQGEYDLAIGELVRCIKLNPSHASAHAKLGWLIYGKKGDCQEAKRLLEVAIDLDPESEDAHLYLANVLSRLGEKERAEEYFQKAILMADGPSVSLASFGTFLAECGRFQEAEEQFRAALDADPECLLALRNYARLLSCRDQDTEAEGLFRKALEINPRDAWTYYTYGQFLSYFPEREMEARKLLETAIALKPHFTQAEEILKKLQPLKGEGSRPNTSTCP